MYDHDPAHVSGLAKSTEELEEKAHAINDALNGIKPTQKVLAALSDVWDSGVSWGYFYA